VRSSTRRLAVAAELGLDIGEVECLDGDRVRLSGAAPGRASCTIQPAPAGGLIILDTDAPPVECVRGRTDDLRAVVTAAAAWRHGATTREVRALAPFVRLPLMAEARARGPEAVVECQWQLLAERGEYFATKPHRAENRMFGEMVAAARAEPGLRRLHPVTSHWILRFSRCTTYPSDWVGAAVEPRSNGLFLVWTSGRKVFLAETGSAREAAAVAAAAVPEGTRLTG
jgi:hypothetical protein